MAFHSASAIFGGTISGNGAIIKLSYTVPFQQLQASLQMQRMILRPYGSSWVLQNF